MQCGIQFLQQHSLGDDSNIPEWNKQFPNTYVKRHKSEMLIELSSIFVSTKEPFKYYVIKEVGGVRKWQFLMIYSTVLSKDVKTQISKPAEATRHHDLINNLCTPQSHLVSIVLVWDTLLPGPMSKVHVVSKIWWPLLFWIYVICCQIWYQILTTTWIGHVCNIMCL